MPFWPDWINSFDFIGTFWYLIFYFKTLISTNDINCKSHIFTFFNRLLQHIASILVKQLITLFDASAFWVVHYEINFGEGAGGLNAFLLPNLLKQVAIEGRAWKGLNSWLKDFGASAVTLISVIAT